MGCHTRSFSLSTVLVELSSMLPSVGVDALVKVCSLYVVSRLSEVGVDMIRVWSVELAQRSGQSNSKA